jgi:WD40 repeat protein
MKRAIFFIIAIILCSFPSQLLALPEGAVARLGKGQFNAVTFSPDGKYLAVATGIGVTLLDPFNLAVIYSFDTTIYMTSITFSPDSSLLASGSDDYTIILWDMKPYIK